MPQQDCNKTKLFAKKKLSSVWEAVLLKLRNPRRKQNPWPSLPWLRSVVVVVRFVADA